MPHHVDRKTHGWLTAEYGMLPGATLYRNDREAKAGKQSGRTVEIQRLIGRSLRRCVHLDRIPGTTISVDCDVIQADAGTRTASISGGCIAVYDALRSIGKLDAFSGLVGAVSVGIVEGQSRLDLDYAEDFDAETDMNVVMIEGEGFVEVQGTAEKDPFSFGDLNELIQLAAKGIEAMFVIQNQSISESRP